MATANVVNQMSIGNSALNFFQRSFQQNGGNAAASSIAAARGFNMITPLENIKHFNSSQQQQGSSSGSGGGNSGHQSSNNNSNNF